MTRSIVFLRAVNVGGRVVRMSALRDVFEGLGFTAVETFIASGNVIVDSVRPVTSSTISRIEQALVSAFGFPIAVFVRTDRELAEIAAFSPFPARDVSTALAFNVGMLAEAPGAEERARVLALRSDIDALHVHGREIYWLCRLKQNESSFTNAVLERTLRRQSTFRSVSTLRKIAAKYCGPRQEGRR